MASDVIAIELDRFSDNPKQYERRFVADPVDNVTDASCTRHGGAIPPTPSLTC